MLKSIASQLVVRAVSTGGAGGGDTSVTEKFFTQPLEVGEFNEVHLQVTPKAIVLAPGSGATVKVFVEISNDKDNWLSVTGTTVILAFNDGEASSKQATLGPGATFNVAIGAGSVRLRIEAISGTAGSTTTTFAVLSATVDFKAQ